MFRRPRPLSQLLAGWFDDAETAPILVPQLSLEELGGRLMPSAVIAQVRQDNSVTPAVSHDEVILVADDGTETTLFNQNHAAGYGAGSVSTAVLADGDVLIAFNPSFAAAANPSASQGGLYRYDAATGTVTSVGPVPTNAVITDLAVAGNGTLIEARTRRGSTAPFNQTDEVVAVAADGTETVLFSDTHANGYGAGGATAIADGGDVLISFPPSFAAGTDPGAFQGGLYRYSAATGTLAPVGTSAGTGILGFAVAGNGTVIEARTRRGSTAPFNQIDEVISVAANGTETVLFSDSNASGYGAGSASTAILADGDVLIDFTPSFAPPAVTDVSHGGRFRYDAATGTLAPIGTVPADAFRLDLAVAGNGTIIETRSRFGSTAPFNQTDEVVAIAADGTETVLFSDTHASGYGAGGATSVADGGDVVIAFSPSFFISFAPGASPGGLYRYNAATGSLATNGAFAPGVYAFDLVASAGATTPPTNPPTNPPVTPPTGPAASAAALTLNLSHDAIVGSTVGGQLSGPTGNFTPFAGYTGALLTAAADVNGDGVADIIVGSASASSHVKVFDGATGALLRSFLAFDGYNGGVSVGAADIDGDGTIDLIVGTLTGSSHVKVLSGKNERLLDSFFAFDGFAGGVRVAGTNNVDGTAEVAVGTATGTSHVKVFKGQSLALVSSQLMFAGYTGGTDVGFADVNGDGTADLLTGTATSSSHVVAIDGKSRTVLVSFFAFPGYEGGVSVAGNGGNIRVGAAGFGPPQVTEFDMTAAVRNSFRAFDDGYLGGVLVS